MRMIAHNPIFGVGLKRYLEAFPYYSTFHPRVAHNSWVQLERRVRARRGGLLRRPDRPHHLALFRVERRLPLLEWGKPAISETVIGRSIEAAMVGYLVCGFFLSMEDFEGFYLLVAMAQVLDRITEVRVREARHVRDALRHARRPSPPRHEGPRPQVAHVLHSMVVAGAETLVHEMSRRLDDEFDFCACSCSMRSDRWGRNSPRAGFRSKYLAAEPGVDLALAGRRLARAAALRRGARSCAPVHAVVLRALAPRFGWRRPRLLFTEHGRHYPDVPAPEAAWSSIKRCSRSPTGSSPCRVSCATAWPRTRRSQRGEFASCTTESIPRDSSTPRLAPRCALRKAAASRGTAVVGHRRALRSGEGPRDALRAFARVVREIPDAKLALAGEGELRAHARSAGPRARDRLQPADSSACAATSPICCTRGTCSVSRRSPKERA